MLFAAVVISLAFVQNASTTTSGPADQDRPVPASSTQVSPARVTHPEIPPQDPSCPNPDEKGHYHVGCGVTAPELTYKVDPELPDEARKKKFSSSVRIELIVDENGKPSDIHVIPDTDKPADKKFAKAAAATQRNAVMAVSQYRFKPATFQGHPVPVSIHVEIMFEIF